MNDGDRNEANALSDVAYQIGAICSLIGEALGADPDKSLAAHAVEGIGNMADQLGASLSNLASRP